MTYDGTHIASMGNAYAMGWTSEPSNTLHLPAVSPDGQALGLSFVGAVVLCAVFAWGVSKVGEGVRG